MGKLKHGRILRNTELWEVASRDSGRMLFLPRGGRGRLAELGWTLKMRRHFSEKQYLSMIILSMTKALLVDSNHMQHFIVLVPKDFFYLK